MKDQIHDEDKDVDEDLYRPYDDCTGHVSDCIDNFRFLSLLWVFVFIVVRSSEHCMTQKGECHIPYDQVPNQ